MYDRSQISIQKIANGFLVTFPISHHGSVILNDLPIEEQMEVQGQFFMKGAQKEQNKDELLEKLKSRDQERRKKMLDLQMIENVFYFESEQDMFKAISEKIK